MDNIFTILSYNTENFYPGDNKAIPENSGYHYNGEKRWGAYRYQQKIKKIGNLIADINKQDQEKLALIGLQEIGSESVLADLCKEKGLEHYSFICTKDTDQRGLYIGLIYNTILFKPEKTSEITVFKNNKKSRPILIVEGTILEQQIVIAVNHWPSKRDLSSNPLDNRKEACRQFISFIEKEELTQKNLIVLGDFNENPVENNIAYLMRHLQLKNPMKALFQSNQGSSYYFGRWSLFDQILYSKPQKNPTRITCVDSAIYKPNNLTSPYGRGGKNTPFRTYRGKQYLGGWSDHFPVWAKFNLQKD